MGPRGQVARVGIGAVVAGGTGRVLQRMVRDFDSVQGLRPSTTALMYAVYVVDLAGLVELTLRPTWRLPVHSGPAVLAGVPLIVVGAAVDVAAVTGFGSAAQLSGVVSGEMVTDGIYRFSRNPQYLGIVTMLVGASLAGRSVDALLGSALVAVVFDRWIRHEERNLSRLFGDDYTRYRASASRWIGRTMPPA